MNIKLLKARYARLFRNPEPGEAGTGEATDRGDDFVPTGPDATAKEEPVAKVEKPLPADKATALKELGGEGTDGEPEGEKKDEKVEGAAGEGDDKDKDKRGKRIPLERHEAILARERARREAAETELRGFQGQKTVVATNDAIGERETKVTELQAQYDKALVDGETTKASTLMMQIRKLDREISGLEAEGKIAAAEARAVESTRYNIALERIEQAYPALNEDHADFDQDTYVEVVDLAKAYRASGRTPTESLQKAVKVLLGSATTAQKDSTSVKPRVDAADATTDKKGERTAAAVDKALAATSKSPGTAVAKAGLNSNAAGAAHTPKDVMKMTQKDFAALDEKELARLRGDEVDA